MIHKLQIVHLKDTNKNPQTAKEKIYDAETRFLLMNKLTHGSISRRRQLLSGLVKHLLILARIFYVKEFSGHETN